MTNTAKPKRARHLGRTHGTPTQPGGEAISMPAAEASPQPLAETAAKPESKAARILRLMQRTEGATLDEMVAETGWLPHTTRAAMTGLKRKGHTITSIKSDGVRRYHAAVAQ